MNKLKVMSVFGTRPEAIKMAPLVKALQASEQIESIVCLTGQHREMLDSVMEIFQLTGDYDLHIMEKRQTLSTITTKTLLGMDSVLDTVKPDLVLVHGDTSTTFAGALAAFYHQVKVGHVEAGLRTWDKYSPFPEEMNRTLVGDIADLHFSPTKANADNLRREAIMGDIFITGNTAIDAARTARRLGAEVTIVYRRQRNDMPCEERELLEAFEEGVRVLDLAAPVEVVGEGKVQGLKCVRMVPGVKDEKLRRSTTKTEEEFVVEVDNIIVAVSQYSDFPFINKDEVVVSKAGRIVLDEKGMSSKPYVFAGGDVVRGAATAIQAIADGKKAAVNINNYLGSQSGITVGEEIVLPELEVGKTSVLSAAKMNNLPIAERVTNQKEVAIGLTEQQVKDECGRCLKCHGTAKVDPSLCLNCSLCWELCTHGAISMEPLDTPHVVTCDYDGSDRVEEIIEICNKAFLRPLDSTCQCTNTTAEEIVRAIMAGARTIKDLHRMTGTGGGCGGYYCSNTMYRLLEAAGYPQTDHETTDTSDYETYHYIKPLLFTLPEGVMDHDKRISHDIKEQKFVQWNLAEVEKGNEMYRKMMKERSEKK